MSINDLIAELETTAAATARVASDPKSELNRFVQRFCKRPIAKGDLVFTTTKYGQQQQCVLKLNALGGQEVVGELAANAKDAEQSAARMTLQVYKAQIDALPDVAPKAAASGAGKATGGAKRQMEHLSHEEYKAKKAKREADVAAGLIPDLSPKMHVNNAVIKILGKMPGKGDVEYKTNQCNGGYQGTVKISCLPDEWKDQLWAGEVKAKKADAEQSAAEIALLTLTTEPKLVEEAEKKKADAEQSAAEIALLTLTTDPLLIEEAEKKKAAKGKGKFGKGKGKFGKGKGKGKSKDEGDATDADGKPKKPAWKQDSWNSGGWDNGGWDDSAGCIVS